MDEVDVSGWAAPDGTPLARDDVVTLVRGAKGKALRYSIAVPDDGRGYVLGDCFVGGQRIEFGGQVVKNAITAYLPVETYRAPIAPPSVRARAVAATPAAAVAVEVPIKAEPDDECAGLLGEEGAAPPATDGTSWLGWLFQCCRARRT